MKRLLCCTFLLALLVLTAGCNKSKQTPDSSPDSVDSAQDDGSEALLVRVRRIMTYADFENVGKKWDQMKDMEKEAYNFLNFGNKVTVTEERTKGDKTYKLYKTPSGAEYWIDASALAGEFVVLTESDVATFTEPDESYSTKQVLQAGDLGYLLGEEQGYLQVEFNAYRPTKADGKPAWVGTKWIKKQNYANDIATAKAAYNLYLAYYWDTQENNSAQAVKFLKEALEDDTISNKDIYHIIKDYKESLENSSGGSVADTGPEGGAAYTPTVDNLRVRSDFSVDSDVVTSISQGTEVTLIELGPAETINNIDGNWMKIKTADGIEGWVFGGYMTAAGY